MSQLDCKANLNRRLQDRAIRNTANLIGYNNVTLYRYSIKESDYKDQTKTLLEVITGLDIFLEIPGDVSSFSTNIIFLEDILPIVALFPWYRSCEDNPNTPVYVDVHDEFEITLQDDFKDPQVIRYEITDKRDSYQQSLVYREFICAPVRKDTISLETKDVDDDFVNPNVQVAKDTEKEVESNYDFY
jgi:hypothetical protein